MTRELINAFFWFAIGCAVMSFAWSHLVGREIDRIRAAIAANNAALNVIGRERCCVVCGAVVEGMGAYEDETVCHPCGKSMQEKESGDGER